MKESKFQMSNPRLVSMKFDINENFTNDSGPVQLKFNLAIDGNRAEDENRADVAVTLYVFDEDSFEDVPFVIQVTYSADFHWEGYEGKVLDNLININAPSILIGYIRPYINQLTAAAGYPPLTIPLFDLNEDKIQE